MLEHFPEKACPGRDPGWTPVFRKKCDKIKKPERLSDSIESENALARFCRDTACGATIEYGFIVAGVALAIVLALAEIGPDGRIAARTLFSSFRFSDR